MHAAKIEAKEKLTTKREQIKKDFQATEENWNCNIKKGYYVLLLVKFTHFNACNIFANFGVIFNIVFVQFVHTFSLFYF